MNPLKIMRQRYKNKYGQILQSGVKPEKEITNSVISNLKQTNIVWNHDIWLLFDHFIWFIIYM